MIETKIIIRGKCSKKDKKDLLDLYWQYGKSTHVHNPGRFPHYVLEHDENADRITLVAVDSETKKPLGFITLDAEERMGKKYMTAVNAFIVPGCQKKGIATGLLKKGDALARKHGAEKLDFTDVIVSRAGRALTDKVKKRQSQGWLNNLKTKRFK